MPVSDQYVVEYLLQQTRGGDLRWRRNEVGYFVTAVNGVDLSLYTLPGSTGTRVALEFSLRGWKTSVVEPFASGFLTRHYKTEDDRRLAATIQFLWAECSRLCAAEEDARDRHEEKQVIFGRLLLQKTA